MAYVFLPIQSFVIATHDFKIEGNRTFQVIDKSTGKVVYHYGLNKSLSFRQLEDNLEVGRLVIRGGAFRKTVNLDKKCSSLQITEPTPGKPQLWGMDTVSGNTVTLTQKFALDLCPVRVWIVRKTVIMTSPCDHPKCAGGERGNKCYSETKGKCI